MRVSTKLVVPLTIPMTRRIGSPRRLSRRLRTSGMPPATAASKSRSTPWWSAASNSSTPTLASSSLLAVTTGLRAASAAAISSRAGSMPPMTSTTMSTSGSATTSGASLVRTPGPSSTSRSRDRLRTATRVTSRRTPVRASISLPCSPIRPTNAPPTLPQPRTPMRTCGAIMGERLGARRAGDPRRSVGAALGHEVATGHRHGVAEVDAHVARRQDRVAVERHRLQPAGGLRAEGT